MDNRQRVAAELLAWHQTDDDSQLCRCGRLLPCSIAHAARAVLDRLATHPSRAIGRAPVHMRWKPRHGLMARAAALHPHLWLGARHYDRDRQADALEVARRVATGRGWPFDGYSALMTTEKPALGGAARLWPARGTRERKQNP